VSDHHAATPGAATGPLLAVFLGRGPAAARYPIRRSQATIGRGAANDVVLDDPSVSEEHAGLRLSGGVWTLSDRGSINGSWVDGEPVHGALPLASGCAVRLGGVELVFAAHDRWEDSPDVARREIVESPGFSLEFTQARRLPVPVLIGLGILLLAVAGYLLTRGG
jgi:pSer/pThr/pTyr-binding forkhead associated (FHA) protein